MDKQSISRDVKNITDDFKELSEQLKECVLKLKEANTEAVALIKNFSLISKLK